ncbi:MAG: hypothetical protein PHF25_08270 [Candidatus Margulisbacteria bacterium]|nr:hypothetical protein [Candidatus Margulisiibacteriota bacterium]
MQKLAILDNRVAMNNFLLIQQTPIKIAIALECEGELLELFTKK